MTSPATSSRADSRSSDHEPRWQRPSSGVAGRRDLSCCRSVSRTPRPAIFGEQALGTSAAIYAVVTYSLVVGWHCPFEFSRSRVRLLWPAAVFHTLLAVEALRWGVQVAGQRPPTSAAIHLGGMGTGVLAAGLLHHRWPGGSASHRACGDGRSLPCPGWWTDVDPARALTDRLLWHPRMKRLKRSRVCMTCASQASPLLSTLPYGLTAVAAVAIGHFTDKNVSSSPTDCSTWSR